jgi:hypothetical protein
VIHRSSARRGLGTCVVTLTCAALLVSAAPASAAQRFASPTGSGTACTSAAPCDWPTAVTGATGTDEVIVAPGDYGSPSAELAGNVVGFGDLDIHGVEGQPRPRIFSSAVVPLEVSSTNAKVRHLELIGSSTLNAGTLRFGGNLVDDVVVRGRAQFGCEFYGSSLVRNTSCLTTNGVGQGIIASGTIAAGIDVTLRNVVAYAPGVSGSGISVYSVAGRPTRITAVNTIAIGGLRDVYVNATGTVATFTASYSNFSLPIVTETSSGGTAVTGDTGGNQTAEPMLADLANGDFHEVAGSPTIDAGIANPANGLFDLDGGPRLSGAAPDIGADEFVAPVAPVAPDVTAPETTITMKPNRRIHKHKAKFKFEANEPGSTFQCQRDRKAVKPCTSPTRLKHLREGKHKFKVFATDAAGNADATPAVARFKVVD